MLSVPKSTHFLLLIMTLCIMERVLGSTVMSWTDCVKELKAHNPELSSTEEATASAEAKKKASFSGFFPQLSATAGYIHSNNPLATGNGSTTQEQYNLGVQATQPLFSGFKDIYRVAQARRTLSLTQANNDLLKARLSAELKTQFTALLYSQEQLTLAESIVKRRQDNLRMVKLRYEGGRENRGSFLFSQASMEQAQFEVAQTQRAMEVAKLNLARVLGRNFSKDLEFGVTGKLDWREMDSKPDFKTLIESIPEHRQAEAQWKIAEANSLIARADFFPAVDLIGSYTKVGSSFPPETKRWSVGVSVSFPFFPGGQSIFNYQSANAEANRADFLKTNTDNQLLAKLQQTYAALLDATGNHKVSKEFLKASETRAIISRGKYQTGLMTFEDWDLIETDLINRQKTELQNRRDIIFAEAAFEQAQGKSVFQ